MEKYYIIADLKRNPAAGEDVPPVPGAQVYVGRMKAIIEAENWETAMKQGQELILGCLKRHIVPYQWVWMPVKDAEKMGDTSIYDRYPTATRLTYERVKAGLTQKQLAERSGVNAKSSGSSWENPRPETSPLRTCLRWRTCWASIPMNSFKGGSL